MYYKSGLGRSPFESFKYWFIRTQQFAWDVIMPDNQSDIRLWESNSQLKVFGEVDEAEKEAIMQEFIRFRNDRPEYIVGREIALEGFYGAQEAAISLYETLLVGVALVRAKCNGLANPDEAVPHIEKCLDWLKTTDFYNAPASTKYHEAYVGGLLYHTLCVINEISILKDLPMFKSINYADAVLVAAGHDWCKIGLYERCENWKHETYFKRQDAYMPLGHGVSSMYLLSRFFKLSPSECLAIRWHQGRWNVCESEFDEFQQANEQIPLVHLLQFADQLAITDYAVPKSTDNGQTS